MTHRTFGPYSALRKVGDVVYVSGQVGINPSNGTAPADIANQTERVLLNLEAVLASANLTLDDVIKTTVFLTDMTDFAAMNRIYERRFSNPRPARSTVAVADLPHLAGDTKLLVEIEAVAYAGASK